jgi:hypothetical protein
LFISSPFLEYKLGIANFFSLHLESALGQFLAAYKLTKKTDRYLRAITGIRICQTITMIRFNKANTAQDIVELINQSEDVSIETLVKDGEKSLNKVVNISLEQVLDFLLIQADELSSIGLHTQSAHALLCYTSICVLFMESIPWRDAEVSTEFSVELSLFSVRVLALANKVNVKMADENLKSYQGAFSMFRSSFYSEYVNASTNTNTFSFNQNIAYSKTENSVIEQLDNEPFIGWQFSPLGETYMQLRFWLIRAKETIDSNVKNIDQRKMLPQGCWAYAMSLWCSGRNLAKILVSKKDKEETNRLAPLAVYYLTKSITYLRIIADNDRHLILPSISQLAYNLWELLYYIVDTEVECLIELSKLENTINLNIYAKAIKNVSDSFNIEDVGSLSASFLNLDYAYQVTSHYLEDADLFAKSGANVRCDVLRNKHYINDDFEDPTFGMFWMYFCGFKTGAKLHQDTMDSAMKSLYEKAKIR